MIATLRRSGFPTADISPVYRNGENAETAANLGNVLEGLVFSNDNRVYRGYGAPGGNRTPGLQVRSLSLYPSELRAHIET